MSTEPDFAGRDPAQLAPTRVRAYLAGPTSPPARLTSTRSDLETPVALDPAPQTSGARSNRGPARP